MWSFEMQQDNIYLLEMSLRISSYTHRVTLFHAALWNKTGTDIYYNYRIQNVGAATALVDSPGVDGPKVKSVRFEDVYAHRHRWAGGRGPDGDSGGNDGVDDVEDNLMSILLSTASSSSSSSSSSSEAVANNDADDIFFLKMYIEGSEGRALEGMAFLISNQKIKHVVIEVAVTHTMNIHILLT